MTAIWNIACLAHPSIFISFSTIFSHLTTTAKMSIIDIWRGPKKASDYAANFALLHLTSLYDYTSTFSTPLVRRWLMTPTL